MMKWVPVRENSTRSAGRVNGEELTESVPLFLGFAAAAARVVVAVLREDPLSSGVVLAGVAAGFCGWLLVGSLKAWFVGRRLQRGEADGERPGEPGGAG